MRPCLLFTALLASPLTGQEPTAYPAGLEAGRSAANEKLNPWGHLALGVGTGAGYGVLEATGDRHDTESDALLWGALLSGVGGLAGLVASAVGNEPPDDVIHELGDVSADFLMGFRQGYRDRLSERKRVGTGLWVAGFALSYVVAVQLAGDYPAGRPRFTLVAFRVGGL